MSDTEMQAVIGRCLLEVDFRELLFADPDRALASYDLTLEERTALFGIDAEILDACAEHLRAQMSRKTHWPEQYDVTSNG
jgi:hypothetical protein